jgi:hypothetical protein
MCFRHSYSRVGCRKSACLRWTIRFCIAYPLFARGKHVGCCPSVLCSYSLPWVNFVIFITSFHEDGVVFVMCLYPSPSNVRCGMVHLSPRNQKSVLEKLRRTKTLALPSEIIHQRLRSTQRSAGGRWSLHYFGRMDVWMILRFGTCLSEEAKDT